MGTIDPPVNFIKKALVKRVFYLKIRMKKELLKINKEYVDRYSLDSCFIGKSIVIYDDRYEHIEKHEAEFSSKEEYYNALNNIKYIVNNPDFIRVDINKKGMYFIKTLRDNIMVVIRVSNSRELKVRTLYPINNTKKQRLKNIS